MNPDLAAVLNGEREMSPSRRYYYRHREEILKKRREDYAKNAEKYKEAIRRWRLENPDWGRKYRASEHGKLTRIKHARTPGQNREYWLRYRSLKSPYIIKYCIDCGNQFKQSGNTQKRCDQCFPLNKRDTSKDKRWRNKVLERDNFTCQRCSIENVKLEAHHIKAYFQHPELRFDLNNGASLCIPCHKKTDSYGKRAKIRAQEEIF